MKKTTVVFMSIVLAVGIVHAGEKSYDHKAFEAARKIIQRVSEISIIERYSEYDKYYQETQKKIGELLDEGIPLEQAVKDVKGFTSNERIEAFKRYFRERGLDEQIIESKKKFKDLIDDEFQKHNLDIIYKYIPWRESQYDPNVCTTAQVNGHKETVKGLWQILETTAQEMGLKVTQESCSNKGERQSGDIDVDERFDPKKSTRAAVMYIKRIINELGNYGDKPELVLASYHNGVDAVKRMIDDMGADFWKWECTDENRQQYGFGPNSYDYVPWVMAAAQVAEGQGE